MEHSIRSRSLGQYHSFFTPSQAVGVDAAPCFFGSLAQAPSRESDARWQSAQKFSSSPRSSHAHCHLAFLSVSSSWPLRPRFCMCARDALGYCTCFLSDVCLSCGVQENMIGLGDDRSGWYAHASVYGASPTGVFFLVRIQMIRASQSFE